MPENTRTRSNAPLSKANANNISSNGKSLPAVAPGLIQLPFSNVTPDPESSSGRFAIPQNMNGHPLSFAHPIPFGVIQMVNKYTLQVNKKYKISMSGEGTFTGKLIKSNKGWYTFQFSDGSTKIIHGQVRMASCIEVNNDSSTDSESSDTAEQVSDEKNEKKLPVSDSSSTSESEEKNEKKLPVSDSNSTSDSDEINEEKLPVSDSNSSSDSDEIIEKKLPAPYSISSSDSDEIIEKKLPIPDSTSSSDSDEIIEEKLPMSKMATTNSTSNTLIDSPYNTPVKKTGKAKPILTGIIDRAPITTADQKDFESSIPDNKKVDAKAVLGEWAGITNKNFYSTIRQSLKIARNDKHSQNKTERDKLDRLIQAYRENNEVKKLIDGAVRVPAKKAEGAVSGTVMDELFKTSETMKYLELSYRPPKDKSGVAAFNGEEFDWMDAQEQIRLSTEFIIWASDLVGEISGHTGTFQKEVRGNWMTTGQAAMHEKRDDAITQRSNPATGIVEALGMYLRVTENVNGFINSDVYKSQDASKALLPNGLSIKELYPDLIEQLEQHRNMLKAYHDYFISKTTPPKFSSPMKSSVIFSPPTKKHEIDINKGKVKGNPLPALASQWRVKHLKSAVIPARQIPKSILEARAWLTKLDKSISARIHKKAKYEMNRVKDENGPQYKVMIKAYIDEMNSREKLMRLNEDSKKEYDQLIQNLTIDL